MTTLLSRSAATPSQRTLIDRRVRAGTLRRILPGVYSSEETETWQDRVMAAQLARPRSVIIGPTAARIHFWEDLADDDIHIAPARFTTPPPWLKPSQTRIPAHLRSQSGELTVASPALAALQTVRVHGPRALTEALRSRVTTPAILEATLNSWPDRPGNLESRRLVRLVRDSPWSELEREAHMRLRAARLTGWEANHRVRIGRRTFYIDMAFPEHKVAVEVDGFGYHQSLDDLTNDTTRQNLLVLAGWLVLRFTSRNLDDMLGVVRQALRQRAGIHDSHGVSW